MGNRRFYSSYNITLERDKEDWNKIILKHYSYKYNESKSIKPSSAREESIIQNLKNMMEDLQIGSLEVKLKNN